MFVAKVKPAIQRNWPAILTVATIIYGLVAWRAGNSRVVSIFGALGLFFISAWATKASLSSSQDIDNQRTERAWRYIGVGLLLWTIAVAYEGFAESILSIEIQTPSLVDLFRLSGSMAFIVAFGSMPSSIYRGFGRIRDLLDLSLIILATLTLFWLIFFRSILMIGLSDPIPTFWAMVHGGFGVILIPLILYRVFQTSRTAEISSYLTFGAGILIVSVLSIVEGYQNLGEASDTFGWLQAGYIMGTSFFIYASNLYMGKMHGFLRGEQVLSLKRIKLRIDALLPMVLVYVVIGFLLLDWWLSGEIDRFAMQATIVMAALLVARQGAIIGQSELLRYAELVNATADMAFICDQEGRIILDNPSLREEIGTLSHEEFLPDLKEILVADLSLDSLLSVASVSGWVGEVRFRRNDGSDFPASLSLIPIQDKRDSKILYAATAHDLTTVKMREDDLKNALGKLADAQKELQSLNIELERKVDARTQELKEMVAHLAQLNEELKALDEMKTEFVALVSHELRAPLTNIQTGLELVLDSVEEAETNESLELIMAETSRLGGFVETILDLSALEAGRFPIQLRTLSLQEIVQDVYLKFKNQPGGERIRITIPKELPFVVADDQGVRSVLYHLLDNAIKYAPEGDIQLTVLPQDNCVTISISDSGPGIPEDERENVFEMFYRMDSRDSRAVYGRGLGLNLARRFLDVMEGGIEIADSEFEGTEIRFWLPKESQDVE